MVMYARLGQGSLYIEDSNDWYVIRSNSDKSFVLPLIKAVLKEYHQNDPFTRAGIIYLINQAFRIRIPREQEKYIFRGQRESIPNWLLPMVGEFAAFLGSEYDENRYVVNLRKGTVRHIKITQPPRRKTE